MKNIIDIRDLSVSTNQGISILNKVNLHLNKGEIIALVGESGSGKTTILRTIHSLLANNLTITNGEVKFNKKILGTSKIEELRGLKIGYIFQEANTCLNPVVKVGRQIQENFIFYEKLTKKRAKEKTIELLKQLKFEYPEEVYNKYPHQLSGGQCQRIMIGSAIANHPDIILADEPISSLDINLRIIIFDLFQELKKKYNMSFIIVTHDIRMLTKYTDRLYVMYKGNILEHGKTKQILENPHHPYTDLLIKSTITMDIEPKSIIETLTSNKKNSTGCIFANKCSRADEKCFSTKPMVKKMTKDHFCSCLKAEVYHE